MENGKMELKKDGQKQMKQNNTYNKMHKMQKLNKVHEQLNINVLLIF